MKNTKLNSLIQTLLESFTVHLIEIGVAFLNKLAIFPGQGIEEVIFEVTQGKSVIQEPI